MGTKKLPHTVVIRIQTRHLLRFLSYIGYPINILSKDDLNGTKGVIKKKIIVLRSFKEKNQELQCLDKISLRNKIDLRFRGCPKFQKSPEAVEEFSR